VKPLARARTGILNPEHYTIMQNPYSEYVGLVIRREQSLADPVIAYILAGSGDGT
jgi:hypothetical protein